MGWNSGPPTWSELARVLSGRPNPEAMYPGDGGDSPAWSRKRGEYRAGPIAQPDEHVPYAELHAHSAYSFLDGAAEPERMVEEAARLGLDALALTDHDGFYGIVRFAEAARELDVRTVFGAELSLSAPEEDAEPRAGSPDPPGPHLLVLARGKEGYRRLSRAIAAAHMAGGEKGVLRYDYDALTEAAGGHWQILTGCRKGHLRRAWETGGTEAADAALRDLVDRFGRDRVSVELTHHAIATDDERNAALAELAARHDIPITASTGAHFAGPEQRRIAMALAAVRARRSLDEAAGWLGPVGGAHLRSGAEMARLFAAHPAAVGNAYELGMACAFDLKLIAPNLPPFDVPPGHTEITHLRHLVAAGARERYGPPERNPAAYRQIEHELAIIEELNFPGYFLVVHDITTFCREHDIMAQGRGSAANSAVCFALGITNVDPIDNHLLFERFLSVERDGPPDIDVDIESDLREQAIQHVYQKYGRTYAAQVANVITYRGKSAVRDAAKALGYAQGQQDAWSKQVSRWSGVGGEVAGADIPTDVLELAAQFEHLPRHLGIHSGGMVICDRPIADVCPVEWARMPDRSVLQWDKDDCAAVGLVKFDLLGLGMLSALHYMTDLVAEFEGVHVDLATLDLTDPKVYEMLQRADSIGVFQVESRAQMATLPRLKPRKFYDLVVEVALIRPGPIQGGSVHPFIERLNGADWEPDHPALADALKATLGVPLFQEQLMQMAVDVADFTAGEADQLRRAMGSKRSTERMERLRERLYAGMERKHGITGEMADRIYEKIYAFANFGFPESHAQSFAALVFQSAWFKLYHPAAFCAGLLRAQPMGFYSPQSLVADARRHGVVVHGPDINHSRAEPTLERPSGAGDSVPSGHSAGSAPEVRLGLAAVRQIGAELAERIVAARGAGYTSFRDLTGRVELSVAQAEALATAGALDSLGITRREALWAAGAAAEERADRLPGIGASTAPPALPGMSELETAAADVWATGVSPGRYPTEFLRPYLDRLGVIPASGLSDVPDGQRVLVGGAVTHRQRPATASGITFVNLEDETGLVNVVCSVGLWARYRQLAQSATALLVRGRVQNGDGVVSVVADHLQRLDLRMAGKSRDFR